MTSKKVGNDPQTKTLFQHNFKDCTIGISRKKVSYTKCMFAIIGPPNTLWVLGKGL